MSQLRIDSRIDSSYGMNCLWPIVPIKMNQHYRPSLIVLYATIKIKNNSWIYITMSESFQNEQIKDHIPISLLQAYGDFKGPKMNKAL